MEIWKDVNFIDQNGIHHNYTGSYQVSNEGRVRSLDRYILNPKTGVKQFYHGKILKGTKPSHGYRYITLQEKPMYRISVHRLVAFHFLENPDNKPCVEHINTIKTDCRVENLRWCEYIENNNNPITKEKQRISNKLAATPEKMKKLKQAAIKQFENTQANWAIDVVNTYTNEEFDSIAKAARSVDKDSEWLARRLRGKVGNDTPFAYKKKYAKIKSIKRRKYKGKVYDLEVANKRSYNIEGLAVHNSVGGSLIAYLMGITTVDPIKYGLLFERFIDVERADFPDIDMDFEDVRRPEIKLHLMDKYGANNIAGVSTFIQMKGKYCVRDVSRVFDVPMKDVNALCEIIDKSVQEALDEDDTFQKNHPEVTKHILALEGNIRTAGQHAAALIISPKDLTKGENSNLVNRKGNIVINWDKDDAEYMGLMKLDVLGLNTLTILNEARRLIEHKTGKEFYFTDIDLEDPKVLKTIDGDNFAGLFQLNGWMARQVTKEIKVDSFHDIVVIMALGRPGPFKSGMTDEYCKRKHGKSWKRMNDVYEEVLKDTYGIVVFQEDVMFVINKVAGLPFSTADKIRKIIGKKRDVKEFAQYEEQFLAGCENQKTLKRSEAQKVWNGFLEWAEYGFNKAHSVEYAMIAYWTAYIKYYHPTEFYCANLTYGKEDKKPDIIKEARAKGLEIVLPKIDKSDAMKWVAKDGKLYCPFIEIKGIGDKMAPKLAKLKRAMPKLNDQFFKRKITTAIVANKEKKSKLEQIADDIGAWGELCPITAKTQEYFSFQVSDRADIIYPNLCNVIDDIFPGDLDHVLTGMVGYPHLIHDVEPGFLEVEQCKDCNLRGRCKYPMKPVYGTKNVAIVDGPPRRADNINGLPLSGDAGSLVWEALRRHKFKKSTFHLTNAVKCFPGAEKVTPKQMEKCAETWLLPELDDIDCRIILSLGTVPAKIFGPKDDGIQKLNATTLWNDKYQSWVCFCVNPASVFADPSNKRRLNHGINNFVQTLKLFGLKS